MRPSRRRTTRTPAGPPRCVRGAAPAQKFCAHRAAARAARRAFVCRKGAELSREAVRRHGCAAAAATAPRRRSCVAAAAPRARGSSARAGGAARLEVHSQRARRRRRAWLAPAERKRAHPPAHQQPTARPAKRRARERTSCAGTPLLKRPRASSLVVARSTGHATDVAACPAGATQRARCAAGHARGVVAAARRRCQTTRRNGCDASFAYNARHGASSQRAAKLTRDELCAPVRPHLQQQDARRATSEHTTSSGARPARLAGAASLTNGAPHYPSASVMPPRRLWQRACCAGASAADCAAVGSVIADATTRSCASDGRQAARPRRRGPRSSCVSAWRAPEGVQRRVRNTAASPAPRSVNAQRLPLEPSASSTPRDAQQDE